MQRLKRALLMWLMLLSPISSRMCRTSDVLQLLLAKLYYVIKVNVPERLYTGQLFPIFICLFLFP